MIGFISFILLISMLYKDTSATSYLIYDHKGGVNELETIDDYIGFYGLFQ